MTTKPPRTYVEVEDEKKIRYLKRTQEEKEARRSLRDFLRHQQEDDSASIEEV
mgnify:FL=1